ncbi:MAG: type II secretion system protein [Patescibacteria group bacterium]|jgi:type II secretory pathway pseudopilin PulG
MKKFQGFSLVEVLVFISVLGLFFTAAMSVTTFNLRNMKIQEHKILATRYAEEGLEWVKDEKETDWSTFITHDTSGTGTMYCLNSLEDGWGILGDCGESYSLGSPPFFFRNLLIKNTGNPVDQVDVTTTVTWKEGTDIKNVQIKSVFKLLE